LAFDSLPGAADPLEGVTGARLGGDASPDAGPGGTRAADGGTDATDAVAVALLAEVDGADDGVAELCEVAVDVTDSEVGGATTRGVGVSVFVTGGFTAVEGDAGAMAVTTGAVVDCVTGGGGDVTVGAGASTACCVCGGASTTGAGSGAGAFGGGAAWEGASTTSGACTFGSGAADVVVMT
jgi:hypothetical protein